MRYRDELKEFITSLKDGKPCKDCGRKFHFCAMQFDHRPGTKKLFNIADIVNLKSSKDVILTEFVLLNALFADVAQWSSISLPS